MQVLLYPLFTILESYYVVLGKTYFLFVNILVILNTRNGSKFGFIKFELVFP